MCIFQNIFGQNKSKKSVNQGGSKDKKADEISAILKKENMTLDEFEIVMDQAYWVLVSFFSEPEILSKFGFNFKKREEIDGRVFNEIKLLANIILRLAVKDLLDKKKWQNKELKKANKKEFDLKLYDSALEKAKSIYLKEFEKDKNTVGFVHLIALHGLSSALYEKMYEVYQYLGMADHALKDMHQLDQMPALSLEYEEFNKLDKASQQLYTSRQSLAELIKIEHEFISGVVNKNLTEK